MAEFREYATKARDVCNCRPLNPFICWKRRACIDAVRPGQIHSRAQDEFSACIVNNYPDEMKLAIVQVNSQYSQKVLFKAVPPGEEKCLPVTVDGSIVNQSGQANLRLRVERLDLRNSVYFDYIDSPVSVVESGWKILFAASLMALAFLFVV